MFTDAKVYANIAKIWQLCKKVAISSDIGEVLLEISRLFSHEGIPQPGTL